VTALHEIFARVCGQQHNWVLGGETLPFCQRCTGLYVGAVLAMLVLLLFRPKATKRMLGAHGLLLLMMAPFGYHLVPQNGAVRMLSGQLFAIGLVYYMLLLPGDYWGRWREPSAHSAPGYVAAGVATVVLLQVPVVCGGALTRAALSWIGFGGLLFYALLATVNVMLLTASVRELLSRRTRSSES
jgi:uncharacterized membrane protein